MNKENLTAKQMQSLYIKSLMHNRVQVYNKELRNTGIVVPCYPLRNLELISYIQENIYKGNTTHCRMDKLYNITSNSLQDFQNQVLKTHSFDEVQEVFQKESIKAGLTILSLFELHINELNNIAL